MQQRLRLTIFVALVIFVPFAKATDLTRVFAEVDNAVVTIQTVGQESRIGSNGLHTKTSSGLGTGVIIRANGLVLTAHHVVAGADRVSVALTDENQYDAKVLMGVKSADIALLQILNVPGHDAILVQRVSSGSLAYAPIC